MSKDIKVRLFEIMQQKDKINLDIVFKWLDSIDSKYLCVLHDKDNDKNIHYHIMCSLEGARSFDDIARQCNIDKQYIERGKSNFNNMCAYAFHLTPDSQKDGKYLYDSSAVIKSKDIDIDKIFSDDITIKAEKKHNDDLLKMFYDYGELKTTRNEILSFMTPQDYAKHSKLFKTMQEYRTFKIMNRNMQVIYITGVSGCGKSTLAKFFARSNNYDVFISGSGKDILDGYDKQECIILDDLRADIFSKAELFKLTDNNTNSSVKSRYNNKDISNCKLMIITSIKAPHNLYNWFDDKDESFKQFARRLNYTYIKINDDDIYSIQYDSNTLNEVNKNNQDFTKNSKIDIQELKMNLVFTASGIVQEIDKNKALKNLFNVAIDEVIRQEKIKNNQISIDDLLDK